MSNKISSVQISKQAQTKLKQISVFTGQTQSQIIDKFIESLYNSVSEHMPTALKSGELITFGYGIKSQIHVPIVTGVFQVPMDMSFEESAKIRDEKILAQFQQIDTENEKRKETFEKALKNE